MMTQGCKGLSPIRLVLGWLTVGC